MKTLILKPDGWPLTIEECPPGAFEYEEQVCFKTEYGTEADLQVFNSAGETFQPRKILVQPLDYEWVEEEEI